MAHSKTDLKRWGTLAVACAGLIAMSGTSSGQSGGDSDTVTVEGCPVAGVEGGCLMLRDKDGKIWDITSAQPRPKIGEHAISLTGRKSTKASHCMQGVKLDEIKWKYLDQTCGGAAESK